MNYPPGYRRALAGTQPEYLHREYVSSQKRAPAQPLVYLPHTLSEITGPVFAAALHPVRWQISIAVGPVTGESAGRPICCKTAEVC